MGKSNISGAWGEAKAAEFLRNKRYTLVAAGYSCRFGEIDLIVRDRKFLVFVEVKLRKSAKFSYFCFSIKSLSKVAITISLIYIMQFKSMGAYSVHL